MRNIDKELDIAGDIFKILLKGGVVGKNRNINLYEAYIENMKVGDYLDFLAEKFDTEIYKYESGLYLTPSVDNTMLGYTNQELISKIPYVNDSKDLYLVNFIIAVIITSFYKTSAMERFIDYIKISDLEEYVSLKLDALVKKEDLEKVNEEYQYNFSTIAKRWLKLKEINDKKTSKNKTTKPGVVNNVCKFLESNDLVYVDEMREMIMCTPRFKAIIENYFEDKDNKDKIYDFIDKLK